jgi:IS5 family transposase
MGSDTMKQISMATTGFEKHARPTRKAEFLAEMERLMPWAEICALIEPHYPKAGNGRPPIGLERMLRMYCLANWFNLADDACEEALYDIALFRDFCGFDLGDERIADGAPWACSASCWRRTTSGPRSSPRSANCCNGTACACLAGTIVDAP